MKTRPILFSAPMVRALLDGRKTMTRRVVKKSEQWPADAVRAVMLETRGTVMAVNAQRCTYGPEIKCPYGQPGDRLWVRETWKHVDGGPVYDAAGGIADSFDPETIYHATRPHYPGPWKPSIFMPRWASRITLEITGVRVERLQDISISDAMAEGVGIQCESPMAVMEYSLLWESINGPGSWDANPWVWVLTFGRVSQ